MKEPEKESIHAAKGYKKKNSTIINEKSAAVKPKAAKEKYYVDNARFYKELIEFIELSKKAEAEGKKPLPPNTYIGSCLMMIAKRVSTMRQFSQYSYLDEMVADAIENCITYIRNFNPSKSKNPFAYFTQIVYYAFIRRIQIEKKQAYIRYKGIMNAMATPLAEVDEEDSQKQLTPNEDFEIDNIKQYVATFEEKNNIRNKAVEKPKALMKKSQVKNLLLEAAKEEKE